VLINMAGGGRMDAGRNGEIWGVRTGDPVCGSAVWCGDYGVGDGKRQESCENTHGGIKGKRSVTGNLEKKRNMMVGM
jgi:hypothetical protein